MKINHQEYACPKCGRTDHNYFACTYPSEENDYTLTINCECGHTFSIEYDLVESDEN